MLNPGISFGFALLPGGQHARYPVSRSRLRATRADRGAVTPAAPAGGLLGPVHGAGVAVELGPGGRPAAVAGGGRRRAALVPVAGDLAAGAVCHPARLRRPAPRAAGALAGLAAPRADPPPGPAPLPDGDRPAPGGLLQARPYPAGARAQGAAADRDPLRPRLRQRQPA